MNSTYIVLGSAVAAVTLLSLVFAAGRAAGRMDEHLRAQDEQIAGLRGDVADLHRKLDALGGRDG